MTEARKWLLQIKKPIVSGEEFEAMLDRYYALRGWDRNGIPTADTLTRLGLEKEGAFLADRREIPFIWNEPWKAGIAAYAAAHR